MPCAFLQVNTGDLCTDLDISEVCESITEFFTVFIPRDWLFRIWTNSQTTSCMCYICICNNEYSHTLEATGQSLYQRQTSTTSNFWIQVLKTKQNKHSRFLLYSSAKLSGKVEEKSCGSGSVRWGSANTTAYLKILVR